MKPNILLLTVDALRGDAPGRSGKNGPLTPHLDRLAARSVVFNQGITNGTWTQAAMPALLTSSYAGSYGGCLGHLSRERPSPVELLQQSGYRTIGISSNPWLSKRHGYDRGFDVFLDLVPQPRPLWMRKIRGGQALLRQPITHRIAGLFGRRLSPPPMYVPAERIHQVVLNLKKDLTAPYFLWVHYMDIHWPYHLDPMLITAEEIARAWRDVALFHKVSWGNGKISEQEVTHFRALYDQSLQYLDAQIGDFLHALESDNRLDDTVIILCADHGEEFLDHGQLGHLENHFFEEIVRVPFWMSVPGMNVPGGSSALVQTMDLMPTVLELAGCEIPDEIEGRSLVPLLRGEKEFPDRQHVIIERPRPGSRMVACRTSTHKFIWSEKGEPREQLYDLERDPYERENLVDALPAIASEMRSIVMAHLSAVEHQGNPVDEGEEPMDEQLVERLRGLGYLE